MQFVRCSVHVFDNFIVYIFRPIACCWTNILLFYGHVHAINGNATSPTISITHTHTHIDTRTCSHMYAQTQTHTHTHTFSVIHVYMYTHTHRILDKRLLGATGVRNTAWGNVGKCMHLYV